MLWFDDWSVSEDKEVLQSLSVEILNESPDAVASCIVAAIDTHLDSSRAEVMCVEIIYDVLNGLPERRSGPGLEMLPL